MKRIVILGFAMALTCLAAMSQISYANTEAKAGRFFDNKEWASAAAVYGLMLHEQPKVADTYGRAIVSNEMLGDSLRAMQLLNQAMKYGVSLDSVLSQVKKYSFAIGESGMYERFMLDAAKENAWMQRPLDIYLLRYYAFRRNGEKMVEYSKKLLGGSPTNVAFLSIAAEGYMIIGQSASAVECWQKIIELDNNNYIAILNMANYYDMMSEPTQAIFYFQRAYELRPTPYVADKLKELINK